MLSAVRKFGNSAGVIIPKPLLSEIGAKAGDSVELKVEGVDS
jgi:antitoxin MazE